MTSFDQLALENLGEAEILVGTGYTRVVFRGLEVIAWWLEPWQLETEFFEADECEPC